MNIVERVVTSYQPFINKIRTLGLILGGISTAILMVGASLPAVVISIAGYLATASELAMSQVHG